MNIKIKEITSKKDPLIQEILAFKKEKRSSYYVIEGVRSVETVATRSPDSIKHIFVTERSLLETMPTSVLQKAVIISDFIMSLLSGLKTAPGILALCYYEFKTGIPEAPGLVCYQISDPGNLGTLLRSAAAFGVTTVICIDGVHPLNQKVVQATTGILHALSIYLMTEEDFFNSVKKDTEIIGLALSGNTELQNVEKKRNNRFVVVGSEARGISEDFLARCTSWVKIPMKNSVESLNVAVAGSIALYELF